MRFATVLSLLLVLPTMSSVFLTPHFGALRGLAFGFLTFFSTLFSSVILYRISPLHPLARYPGPVLAKVSKFWHIWNSWDGKQHLYIQALHNKYGDIVRIGKLTKSLQSSPKLTPGPRPE